LFILTSAASRENNWAWWLHVSCAVLAPAGYIIHRLTSRKNKPSGAGFKRFGVAVASLLMVMVAWHGLTNRDVIMTEEAKLAMEKGLHEGPGSKNRNLMRFS
jgi:hypothetical protein